MQIHLKHSYTHITYIYTLNIHTKAETVKREIWFTQFSCKFNVILSKHKMLQNRHLLIYYSSSDRTENWKTSHYRENSGWNFLSTKVASLQQRRHSAHKNIVISLYMMGNITEFILFCVQSRMKIWWFSSLEKTHLSIIIFSREHAQFKWPLKKCVWSYKQTGFSHLL